MSGQHAEVAFCAGDVDLIHFAGEGELFGGNEIEMEGGHGNLRISSSEYRVVGRAGAARENYSLLPIRLLKLLQRASCPSRPPLRWFRPYKCPFPRSRGSRPWWRQDARTRWPAPDRSSRRPARRSPAPR